MHDTDPPIQCSLACCCSFIARFVGHLSSECWAATYNAKNLEVSQSSSCQVTVCIKKNDGDFRSICICASRTHRWYSGKYILLKVHCEFKHKRSMIILSKANEPKAIFVYEGHSGGTILQYTSSLAPSWCPTGFSTKVNRRTASKEFLPSRKE